MCVYTLLSKIKIKSKSKMSQLVRECQCTQEDIRRDYPGLKIDDACPACSMLVAFHNRSQEGTCVHRVFFRRGRREHPLVLVPCPSCFLGGLSRVRVSFYRYRHFHSTRVPS